MNDKERLSVLIDHYAGGSQQAFARLIGVPRASVATWMHRGTVTARGREAILDALPQVTREWLLGQESDEERELRQLEAERAALPPEADDGVIRFSPSDLVPLMDGCRASCGLSEQFADRQWAEDYIRVPGARAVAAVVATGDSMEPTIHSGDYCLVGPEVTLDRVSPRAVYLLVTRQGQCMFKRIQTLGARPSQVLALSDNPDYSPHAAPLDRADILHIHPLTHVIHKMG